MGYYGNCTFRLWNYLFTISYVERMAMTEQELKATYCCRCVNSDCNFDCIAKQEAPFDTFICDNGEMFEELEE